MVNKLEEFVPQIIKEGFGLMIIKLQRCPSCNGVMVDIPQEARRKMFSLYMSIDLKTQLERADWKLQSNAELNGKKICEKCEKEGRSQFKCFICEKDQPTSMIHNCHGDPPDFVCINCYKNIPAEKWDQIMEKLYKIHRYDFD